jgi:hypothetical protein
VTTPATSKGPTLNERAHAILDQKDKLKAEGWKFRDYADGRWMATHKARGLKTGKHDSMVEVINEAARLAEERTAEVEGTGEFVEAGTPAAEAEMEELREMYAGAGSNAEANEGSAYEGQDVAALLAATESEQRGRWEAMQALSAQIQSENNLSARGRKRRKKLGEERGNIARLYEATYSEVIDASGPEAAAQMRERVETEYRPDDVDDSWTMAPVETGVAPADDTPAIDPTPAEPRTFRDTFDVKLDDHDIASKARTLSLLRVQIEELQAEMKKTVESYKSKIGGLEEQCAELFKAIRRGFDELELEVYERRDYDRKVVETVRADSEAVVDSRPMKPTEMQPRLIP